MDSPSNASLLLELVIKKTVQETNLPPLFCQSYSLLCSDIDGTSLLYSAFIVELLVVGLLNFPPAEHSVKVEQLRDRK